MAKTQSEDDKKHGDKLESLIERTGGGPSPKKRVTKDDPAQLEVDDQDVEDDDVEDDDAEDDDADDDDDYEVEDRHDIGGRD